MKPGMKVTRLVLNSVLKFRDRRDRSAKVCVDETAAMRTVDSLSSATSNL